MKSQSFDHVASRQELDRLLGVFSQLDDASVEDEHLAISRESGDGQKRLKARLSQPVLKTKDIHALLDGARQGRAFSRRIYGSFRAVGL